MTGKQRRPGTWESLGRAFASWRTASVTLLSFSSGLPLGLLWIAIPDWMRQSGIDIRVIGLFTLVQAPYMFKMLWSPFMDRYVPPWLGRRRGWIVVAQVVLAVLTLGLGGVGDDPDLLWIIGAVALAIAFASASQDIVIDAYAVEVLRKEEQGVAVGARIAVYRAAMFVAGGVAITVASWISWPLVFVLLGLCYVALIPVTVAAPEPEERIVPPRRLREAVWEPFLGFLSRHRALEILAFVIFYKFADQLAQSLQRPFLVDMGYDDVDRGVALTTVGTAGTISGTFIGGALTTAMGLGHSLWVFGLIQIFSNLGFVLVSQSELNRPLMFGAMGFEAFASGLGMGAYGVLLLRLTQKRFSATQYALFSSLFGIPRLIAGPIAGQTVHDLGWTTFFWLTIPAGIPGLILLARFVPLGRREPEFRIDPPRAGEALSKLALAWRGALAGIVTLLVVLALLATIDAASGLREGRVAGFDLAGALTGLMAPRELGDALQLAGSVVFAIAVGLLVAAAVAARHGAAPSEDPEAPSRKAAADTA